MPTKKMSMRVVGGIYRHRFLSVPADRINIRPTKDRVREAIFSALGDVTNFCALDLYAGSGALGIEALSRGASFVYFVDNNLTALKTINENLNVLGIDNSNYLVIAADDVAALEIIKQKHNAIFDLVFLDPPYAKGDYENIIQSLFARNLLSMNAIIVCESDRKICVPSKMFKKVKEYHYGETLVTILWR